MASFVWGCVTDFFTYETTKSVVVKSWSVGIINRIVQVVIITYFIGWVFIHEKAYQVTDTGIESSVMTKVKGFGYQHNRTMDVADYVFPQQGASVFCIMTKLIITEDQYQGRCKEHGPYYTCEKDEDCHKHYGTVLSNGVITGACILPDRSTLSTTDSTLNTTDSILNTTNSRRKTTDSTRNSNTPKPIKGQCEIEGWCPAENDAIKIKPMNDVKNFTIFIKNSIRFPLFNVTRGNFPSDMTSAQIKSCLFHPERAPFCPIFRVRDIVHLTGQDVDTLTDKGAEIGINIEWKCNLDQSVEKCVPKYSFTRLDAAFAKNAVSKGYNFRFAKYFKTENGTEFRTLHKAYAIRFDVMVTGNAGKFGTIPTLINLVAAFTSIGLGTVLCDLILLNFIKGADQYKAKKFEEVTEEQIEASLAQSPGSQLSLKPGIKSSYDSGALSLDTSDQPV